MPTQQMISGVTTYDNVRIVDAIVDEGEQGIFVNSARLVDQVLRDAEIFSVVQTRVLGLLGKPLEFEPAKDTTRSSGHAEELESEWPSMAPQSVLAELLTWGILQGVGLAQIVEDKEPWRLEVWHPWCLTWDEYERQYYVSTREDSRLYILPDGEGGFRDKNGTRWVLYTPYGFDNAGRRGIIRNLARLYLERQWAHRDRGRYSEVHGQPMRLGIAPENATPAEVKEFKRQLSTTGAEPVAVVRQGTEGNKWDAKLLEANGKSNDLFDGELAQLDREVATLVLGQSQTTDGQAGLGSNDQAGEPVRIDIMRADGNSLSDCLRSQFLCPYWQFAYGKAALAPWLCWKVDPPEDRAKKALEFKTLMDGLSFAKSAGAPVDVRALLEDYGFPMLTEKEEEQENANEIPTPVPVTSQDTPGQNSDPATVTAPVATNPDGTSPVIHQKTRASEATLALTATDLATIVKVNEARHSVGLVPVSNDVGELWVREHAVKVAGSLSVSQPTTQGSQTTAPDGKQEGE